MIWFQSIHFYYNVIEILEFCILSASKIGRLFHHSYKSNRGKNHSLNEDETYDFLKEARISQILQRASYPAEGFWGDSKISCDVFLRDSTGQIREYFSEVNVSFGGVLDQEAVFSVKFIPDSLFKEYDPQILESIIVADQFSDLGCLTYHNS